MHAKIPVGKLSLSAVSMSDNSTTAAAGKEVGKEVLERERRDDRFAAAEQPAATSSDSRAASQKWRVRGEGSRPGGGKNAAHVKVPFGPFLAPTKEVAERMRVIHRVGAHRCGSPGRLLARTSSPVFLQPLRRPAAAAHGVNQPLNRPG